MSDENNKSVLEKIDDLYENILDMLFPKRAMTRNVKMEKQRKRADAKREKADKAEVERKYKARVSGRGVFW
ncbi:MAG: hypothetical protein P8H03_02445, partial [Emcibacteraceae bacterium]|nr:hypothetical protein [Emcibacteraceae bacterium]